MAKASFNKKYTLSACGVLAIDGDIVSIENLETGELVPLAKLMEDFADRTVKLSLTYDEEYVTLFEEDE